MSAQIARSHEDEAMRKALRRRAITAWNREQIEMTKWSKSHGNKFFPFGLGQIRIVDAILEEILGSHAEWA